MKTKLGVHSIVPTEDAKRMVQAGIPLVKMLDDFGAAAEYLAINPNLIIIGRSFSDLTAEGLFHAGHHPVDASRIFVQSQLDKYKANPLIKLWEGPNEPVWSTAEEMTWYAEFEKTRLLYLAEFGLRGVIGNFSVGNPDLPLWKYFEPAIASCIEHDGILGMHEYSTPFVWWMSGKHQVNPNEDAGDEGWVTLRYRKVLRQLPENLRKVKIAITEFGLDRVFPVREGWPSGRWRDVTDFWNTWDGHDDPIDYWRNGGRDPEIYYAEQLLWYDREIQKDDNVVGATIFTFGTNNSAWEPLNIAGTRVVDRLVERIGAPVGIPPIIPTPQGFISNPGFEEGFYHWHNIPEIVIPNGWDFWYQTDKTLRLESPADPAYPHRVNQEQPFDPPELVVWNRNDAPPAERDKLFLGGTYNVKGFAGFKPNWWKLITTARNLVVGTTYRFTAPVFPDLVMDTVDGKKLFADDPLAGEHRLSVKFPDGTELSTPWLDGTSVTFGEYNRMTIDFTATGPEATLEIEVRGRWGLESVGWFIDEVSLVVNPNLPPVIIPPGTGKISDFEAVTLLEVVRYVLWRIGSTKISPAQKSAISGIDQEIAELMV